MHRALLGILVLVGVAVAPIVDAQVGLEPFVTTPPAGAPASVALPEAAQGATNCFEDYHFGSVQADVEPTLAEVIPGVALGFQGQVFNDNSYPVVEGRVFVKIFRLREEGVNPNGHDVVDAFIAADGLALPANGTTPLTFTWQVPANAAAGEYEAVTYFLTSERFNLLGLSFTDDVTGNKASFRVNSQKQPVGFDKNAVTLNGKEYRFAAYPPHFTTDETVTASMPLVNSSKEARTVQVVSRLYTWDSQRDENLLDEEIQTVVLLPKETKRVEYAAEKKRGAVSLLEVTATDGDARSILSVRFVRDGITDARINFPSLTSYPVRAHEANALFACLHGTTETPLADGELAVSLTDGVGNVIHDYTYRGPIRGAMMGTREAFTPAETYGTVYLTATLKANGEVLDTVRVKYDCTALGETNCPVPQPPVLTASALTDSLASMRGAIILGVLLITICSLGLILWKRRAGRTQPPLPPAAATLLLALLVGGGLVLTPKPSLAKSVVWNTTEVPKLFYYFQNNKPYPDFNIINPDPSTRPFGLFGWAAGLYEDSDVSITYRAQLTNVATGAPIADNSSVATGTVFRADWIRADTDISWFGTGLSLDSPFGTWRMGATDPPDYCTNYFLNNYLGNGVDKDGNPVVVSLDVYVPLSVHPPLYTVIPATSNLACAGNICTVTGPGAVNLAVEFDPTFGKFYYRYSGYTEFGGNGCYVEPGIAMKSCTAPLLVFHPVTGAPVNVGVICGLESTGEDNTVDYTLSVPRQDIDFTLTGVGAAVGNAPSVPTLAPAFQAGPQTANFTFTVKDGIDPDGDSIRYGLDWDNNGSVDQWYPAMGYIPSGGVQTPAHSAAAFAALPLSGPDYFVQALTEDIGGRRSGWSTPVRVQLNPGPTVDLKVNGSDGPVSLIQGDDRHITWVSNASVVGCTATSTDGFSGPKAPTGDEHSPANFTTLLSLQCTDGAGGTTTETVQVNVSCAPACGAWSACDCTAHQTQTCTSSACVPSVNTQSCVLPDACRDFNYIEVGQEGD